jgi:tripartite-type tricarboxylate transporter receptor subunit TctC
LSGGDVRSQAARTIKFVVPYAPGGANDILARLLAEQINRAHGTQIVVENRPGAGTIIGTEAVSRAASDAKTLLFITNPFVINPHLRNLTYDPLTSFEPICHLVSTPTAIVVNGASPYRTLASLVDAARVRPGDLTMASVGPGSATQLAVEMLKHAAEVNLTYIPYSGEALVANALLGEHVVSALVTYPSVAEHLKAGKLHALAAASLSRVELLPDVPTVAESGYENYEAEIWYGVAVSAKTPREAIAQLAGLFIAALQAPEIKRKLIAQGMIPIGRCGGDFGVFLRKQYDDYGRVIREANIKAP